MRPTSPFSRGKAVAKTIMVVDDSLAVRQLVSVVLKSAGYDVVDASDGREALSKLGMQKVHLIISDVNMPNMDGISFVKAVKELPNYKFIPIIMLTTESQETKKQQGQAAGAKAWMVKPFKPDQMLAAVAKLMPA
jgi:two-component system chemotaxis response regulator CheY